MIKKLIDFVESFILIKCEYLDTEVRQPCSKLIEPKFMLVNEFSVVFTKTNGQYWRIFSYQLIKS